MDADAAAEARKAQEAEWRKDRYSGLWLALFGFAMNLFVPGFWVVGCVFAVLFVLVLVLDRKPKSPVRPATAATQNDDADVLSARLRSDKRRRREADLEA